LDVQLFHPTAHDLFCDLVALDLELKKCKKKRGLIQKQFSSVEKNLGLGAIAPAVY
jgi:hypothetical protein